MVNYDPPLPSRYHSKLIARSSSPAKASTRCTWKFRVSRRRSLKKILKRQKDAYCSRYSRNVFKSLIKCNLGTSIYKFPGSIFRLWPKKWIGKFHFIRLLKDPSWSARRDLSNELFRIFLRLLLLEIRNFRCTRRRSYSWWWRSCNQFAMVPWRYWWIIVHHLIDIGWR